MIKQQSVDRMPFGIDNNKVSIIGLLFVFSYSLIAVPQVQTPTDDRMSYRTALLTPAQQKSCQTWKTLANKSNSPLSRFAKLREARHCLKQVNWQELAQKFEEPEFQESLIQTQFDWLVDNKKYSQSYKLYKESSESLDIENRVFDQMATGALKAKLSRSDRKQLRNELEKKSPRYILNPKKKDYLRVARDFRRDRLFEKALFYYRKVINDPKRSYHDRWYGFQGARITYKIERWSRMKKYIRASRQWADFLKNKYKWSKEMTRLHHDANIEYIRTLWTEKGQGQALKRLKKLERQMKGRYSLQTIYWLRGRMAEEKKNYKAAINDLMLASQQPSLGQRGLDRIYWSLSWNQRRIGKFQEAQRSIAKLLKSPELQFFGKTKYLYWQAENFASMNQTAKAQQAFDYLAQLDLYGFYGALAIRKLNRNFPTPTVKRIDEKEVLGLLPSSDQAMFSLLKDIGEIELAEALVRTHVTLTHQDSAQKWSAYLSLLQKAGAYKSFFRKYHSLPPKLQLAVLEAHPYLLFPQPFEDQVKKSSDITRISPSLIYSIMKQESGFDIRARSHADAFGLLQLIPQVARKIASEMPTIQYKKPYDLFKPQVVIPLGAGNLRSLFSRFDSQFILSVASYNASEKAVRNWVKTRFFGDPVTFIEDIPYEETKGYVKLVMRNYISYNRFASPDQPFRFPESCLEGLQAFKN